MATDNQALMERIKKLMALAQSSNPNEASIALSRAQKLMQEHELSMDDINLSEIDTQNEAILPAMRDKVLFTLLAHIIMRAFGVEAIFKMRGKFFYAVSFIGPRSRLQAACYTFTILSRQAAQVKKDFSASVRQELKIKYSLELELEEAMSYVFGYEEKTRRFINNEVQRQTKAYVRGWLNAVYTKVIDFAQSDSEIKLIESYMSKNHPNLTTMRRRRTRLSTSEWEAFEQGKIDGQNGVTLFQGINGQDTTAKLQFKD